MRILFFSLVLALGGPTPEPSEISGILDALYAPIEDVYFEFEGTLYYANTGDRDGSNSPSATVWESFSGSFLYRGDGATKQESFHRQNAPHIKAGVSFVTRKVATLKRKTMRYDEQAGLGGAETSDESFTDYYWFGSAGRLFFVQYLKAFARYPPKRVIHEEPAVVDGHPCEVFSFVIGKHYEKGTVEGNFTYRFFMDFERGGHPLKVELYQGVRLIARTIDIKLETFRHTAGRSVWLPVSGRYESPAYPDRPENTEVISVMKRSVRINSGIPDEQFRLRLKDGTIIHDGTTGKQVRAGAVTSDPPVSLTQAQDQLRSQIRQAEEQGKEVKATSLARSAGGGMMGWLPWAVSLLSVVVASVVVLQRRARR